MTQIALAWPFPYPEFDVWTSNPAVSTSMQIATAVDRKMAAIIRVPRTGTLDGFEFFSPLYNGTNTVRASFQDVDLATGFPDGGVDQYRAFTPSNNDWSAPGIISSDGTDTGTKRSVTAGDYLACVVDFTAFTSGAVQWRTCLGPGGSRAHYGATYNGAAWAKHSSVAFPGVMLKYTDGYYLPLDAVQHGINSYTTISTFNTGSTPDEVGVKFEVPFDCTVMGAQFVCDIDGDCTVKLYDASDNLLASCSIDATVRNGSGLDVQYAVFDAPVALDRDTTYRLTILPGSATNLTMYKATFDSTGLMANTPGGSTWHLTQRTDAGAWTDTTTERPYGFALRVSKIDDGTGTGGGVALSRVRVGM